MKILLVDDSIVHLERTRSILADSDLGCELLTCTSGRDVLGLIETEAIDLVLLDIVMPDLGGLEVLKQIKARPRHRDVQVIMVTGWRDWESVMESFALGATDYITKPIEATEFLARVRAVLRVRREALERKQTEEQLRHLSMHDSLTGLYNRAYFEEEMRRLDAGREDLVSLVVCDIDGLKPVNDTLGHGAGDTLLKTAAHVIRGAFRDGDVVARVGGDEFAVLLPRTNSATAAKMVRRLGERVAKYNTSRPEIPLSISTGYATREGVRITLNELFRQADDNMYREKRRRKKDADHLSATHRSPVLNGA